MFVHKKKHNFGQNGQVLLIVVLVMIVSSTIVLSLVSRSITSIRTSTEEIGSQKALSAAEAGIERVIKKNILVAEDSGNFSGNLANDSSYSTEIVVLQNSKFPVTGGNKVLKDEGADIWLVDRDSSGDPIYSTAPGSLPSLQLFWGSGSEECGTSNPPAAIQTIVVTRDKNTQEVRSYRYVYDSCPGRRSENNFTAADPGSFPVDYDGDGNTDVTFANRTPSGSLAQGARDIVLIRAVPLYNDAVIGIDGCVKADIGYSCPSQGATVCVTGKFESVSRKICIFKGHSQIFLPYLSYGLFVADD